MNNVPLTKLELEEVSYMMYLPDAETDYIQQKITRDKQPYEYAMLRDMATHLGDTDVFVDIGANIGNHSMYIAAVTGCQVHAFEPNPHLAAGLKQSVLANSLQQKIAVHQLGLGATAGQAHFSVLNPANLGAQSLEVGQGDIQVTTLDEMLAGKSVKVIKIDVEGMELAVLQGAVDTIKHSNPVIYIECQTKENYEQVSTLLAEHKYGYLNTFNATPTHLFMPLAQLKLEHELQIVTNKLVGQVYDLKDKQVEISAKLKSANDKYRSVVAEQEAAKHKMPELNHFQQKVEELEKRLAEANEKYRLSCVNIDLEKTKRQQLSEQLQEKHQLWIAANQKYKDATEQIAKLKHLSFKAAGDKNSNELTIPIHDSESSRTLELQVADAATRLQRATGGLAALNQQIDKLQAEHQNTLLELAETVHLNEAKSKQIVHLTDELQLARQQFKVKEAELAAGAAEVQRAAGALEALTLQLTKLQAEQQETQLQLAEALHFGETKNQMVAGLTAELQQVRQQLEIKATELNTATSATARAEGNLVSLTQKLVATEQQLQESGAELSKLQQALTDHRSLVNQLSAQLDDTTTELSQAVRLRAEAQQSAQNMHALMQQQNNELMQLQSVSAAQQKQRIHLQQELDLLTEKYQQQQELYQLQQQQLTALTVAEQVARQGLQQQSAQAAVAINELKQKLEVIQELHDYKHRAATLNPYYQQLTEKLSAEHNEVVQLQQKLAGLQQQFDHNHAHLKNARRQLEQKQQLENQNIALEQQLATQIKQKDSLQQQYINDRSELDLLKALQKVAVIPAGIQPHAQLPAQLQSVFTQVLQQQQMLAQIRSRKIACIMDEFTFGSYAPEANLLQLTPQHWQRELAGFQPDLLFIESAWRGKHEIWGNKVGHKAQELVAIVEWCRQHNVPTIFWNKEDPVHFETFISTAKLFDHVFTTDFDCIHRYKAALEHNNVYLLPFAAQPSVNNPIELYPRKDAFSFAGAYYVRYPDRTRDLDDFLQHLPHYKPVEIYDRNFGKNDPNYMFPESYQSYIVGNLPYDQIDKAYKGYRYAINLNSIKHSQTMFARRAYELLASNTLTVSNYSRGIELMFGELVLNSDGGQQIVERLNRIEQDSVFCRKFQLQALRKVLLNHTYQDRLGYILQKAGLLEKAPLLPQLVIAAYASSKERAERILTSFHQQQYSHKQLLLVIAEQVELAEQSDNVQLLTVDAIKNARFGQLLPAGSWFGFMVADDYYGPNYLTDLALATRYSPAPAIGKVAHYRYVSADEIRLNHEKKAYRLGQKLEGRSAIFRTELFPSQNMYQWLRKAYQLEIELPQILAIDPFNYCKAVPLEIDLATIRSVTDDAADIASGMPYAELEQMAEQLPAQKAGQLEVPAYTAQDLHRLFNANAVKGKVQLDFQPNYIDVMSELPDGKHEYLYADTLVPVQELPGTGNGQFDFFLEASTGMNLQLLVVFLNADKAKISHEIRYANKNHSIALPADCVLIQFALRFYASGACSIKRLVFGHLEQEPQQLLPQSDVLLLTNHYPSYQDLYRNGFVHTRVKAYREHSVAVDVFRMRKDEPVTWHEYQSVQVCTGSQNALRKALETGRYRHVLVHFLDPDMWDVLKDFIADIRVTVWVHGAEIHPWYRRKYNINNQQQEDIAKASSEIRMQFWASVLKPVPKNLKLIFVSNYFANEVMEDLGFEIPKDHYQVIPNPIDTKLFNYVKKNSDSRKKLLSIRPFASRQYANDLTVAAILELSNDEFFNELEFRIIGDGPLFKEVIEPIVHLENVFIEQRFVSQPEISQLHKEHGIFLCPTRWDSQGVSRDEAMASGLVAVTTNIAAIPEYTDENTAMVAEAENAKSIAENIRKIILSEQLFIKISEAAAERIKSTISKSIIIPKELDVINAR